MIRAGVTSLEPEELWSLRQECGGAEGTGGGASRRAPLGPGVPGPLCTAPRPPDPGGPFYSLESMRELGNSPGVRDSQYWGSHRQPSSSGSPHLSRTAPHASRFWQGFGQGVKSKGEKQWAPMSGTFQNNLHPLNMTVSRALVDLGLWVGNENVLPPCGHGL